MTALPARNIRKLGGLDDLDLLGAEPQDALEVASLKGPKRSLHKLYVRLGHRPPIRASAYGLAACARVPAAARPFW
jgi:hypothetical protein